MNCSACKCKMEFETEMKENGFWFQWFRCPHCGEGYLNKSEEPLTDGGSIKNTVEISSEV